MGSGDYGHAQPKRENGRISTAVSINRNAYLVFFTGISETLEFVCQVEGRASIRRRRQTKFVP